MSNSRKFIWFALAIFMVLQVSISFWVSQNNMKIVSYYFGNSKDLNLHFYFMFYFSLMGTILFFLSFIVYQMDGMKAKKQIAKLEQDKNELKAKLFDMQEAQSPTKLPTPIPKPLIESSINEKEDVSEEDTTDSEAE